MDKLLNKTRTAVDTVKEKVPFLDRDSEPGLETEESSVHPDRYIWSEKVNRFRDIENGRFVSREKALGEVAVGQVVKPPVTRQLNGASSSRKQASANGTGRRSPATVGSSNGNNKSSSINSLGNPSAINQNIVLGPTFEDLDLEAIWNSSGNKEDIATKIMSADPALYLRYVAARDRFIISEANARGAGLSDPTQKTSLLGRLRNKLPERFRKGEQQTQARPEEFGQVYDEALKLALAGFGNLSPKERHEKRLELEADAGYALEWDVSKKKMDASEDKKFSLSRRAATFGGLLIAGAAGAGTGVLERLQKGEHDLKFLGMAAVFGAATGFGAAKVYKPKEDDDTVTNNAEVARRTIESKYGKNSLDSLGQRAVGIEGVRSVTKRDKRKALGRVAIGIVGGAAAGAGGHLLVDAWQVLSNFKAGDIQESPASPESTVDSTLGIENISKETYGPLDTNHDGVVNGYDMPDTNHDGIVDYMDQAKTYDPLDTNHDGVVNALDMPDNNSDGVITVDDSHDPLDTNRDGTVDKQDMPDTNHDGVIDSQDQAKTYDPLDTNHDSVVNNNDMQDTNSDNIIDRQDQAETYDPLDTNRDGVVNEQDIPDTNGDDTITVDDLPRETDNEATNIQQEPAEKPAQEIYIEPGSGISNEFHQYAYDTYGVDLSDNQLNDMYVDLIDSGDYTPEQIFDDVNFYTMEDGRWGIEDVGSAELTGTGQTAIGNWLAGNGLMHIAA